MAAPKFKTGKKTARTGRSAVNRRPVQPGEEVRIVAPPRGARSTLKLADDVLENPGLWLRTANPRLGDRPPIDLIGTEEEFRVYNLLNAVDQGLF